MTNATYLATADLGTITGEYNLGVNTIVPTGDDETGIGNTAYLAPLAGDDFDAWDDQLAAAGFTRLEDWKDCGGYHTAGVEHSNAAPTNLPELRAALTVLEQLDPMHRARRLTALSQPTQIILGAERDAAIYAATRNRDWAQVAREIGVSKSDVNGAVSRHNARIAAIPTA